MRALETLATRVALIGLAIGLCMPEMALTNDHSESRGQASAATVRVAANPPTLKAAVPPPSQPVTPQRRYPAYREWCAPVFWSQNSLGPTPLAPVPSGVQQKPQELVQATPRIQENSSELVEAMPRVDED